MNSLLSKPANFILFLPARFFLESRIHTLLEATANFFKAGKASNAYSENVASLDDASEIPYSNDRAYFTL